jgi:hypothetical protein
MTASMYNLFQVRTLPMGPYYGTSSLLLSPIHHLRSIVYPFTIPHHIPHHPPSSTTSIVYSIPSSTLSHRPACTRGPVWGHRLPLRPAGSSQRQIQSG